MTGHDRAAQQFVGAALEERLRGLTPPDLTESILAAHGRRERGRRTGMPQRWLAAALLAAGLATVVAVPLVDGGTAGNRGASGDGWYPLGAGARWEYRSGAERIVDRVVGHTRVGDRTVYSILRTGTGDPAFRYLAVDAGGLHEHAGHERRPVLHAEAGPATVLQRPAVSGRVREETLQRPGRPAGAAVQGRRPAAPGRRRTTVVAVDAVVEVPAGRFETVHLRIDAHRGGAVAIRRDVHLAPGVGIVRSETRRLDAGESGARRLELVRFTPGQRLPAIGDAGVPDDAVPVELADLGLAVTSRFVAVANRGDTTILRLHHDGGPAVEPFDPEDRRHWNGLIAAEPLFRTLGGRPDQVPAATLAELAGRLHAARAGLPVRGAFDRESVNIGERRQRVGGRLAVGPEGRRLRCVAVLEGGRAVTVEVR